MTGLTINDNVLSINGRTLVKASVASGIGLAETDIGLVLENDKLMQKDTTGKGVYMYGGEVYYGDNILNSNGTRFVVPISREDYLKLVAGEKIVGIGTYSPSVLYYINGSEKKEYEETQHGNVVSIAIGEDSIARVASEYKVMADVSSRVYYGVGDRVIVRLSAAPVSPVKLVLSGDGITFDDYDITFDANNWYVAMSVRYSTTITGKHTIVAKAGKEQTSITIDVPTKILVFRGSLMNGATVKEGNLVVDSVEGEKLMYIGKFQNLKLEKLPINPNRVQELYFVVRSVTGNADIANPEADIRYIPNNIDNSYVQNYWHKSFKISDVKAGITKNGVYAASFSVGRGVGNFNGINHIIEIVAYKTESFTIKEISILDYGN